VDDAADVPLPDEQPLHDAPHLGVVRDHPGVNVIKRSQRLEKYTSQSYMNTAVVVGLSTSTKF
jgi:hypothetical protein